MSVSNVYLSSKNYNHSAFSNNSDRIFNINNTILKILNSSYYTNNDIKNTLNGASPSVKVTSDRDIIGAATYDALSRIHELVQKGDKDSSVINNTINTDMMKSSYYLGAATNATESDYASYETVPTGSFQVYTPPTLSETQLQSLIKTNAGLGALVGGNQTLYKAILDGSATIYNQEDSKEILGTPADWKQGSIGGTMWDKTQINQQAIQKLTEEGKQIFAGAIGNIHFAVAY